VGDYPPAMAGRTVESYPRPRHALPTRAIAATVAHDLQQHILI
jgi:hypothetical protein